MIGVYGAEISWDLRRILNLDLDDFLAGRRDWRWLFDWLDWLPTGSRYRSAKMRSPEVVEHMLATPRPNRPTPPLEEFSLLRYDLATIIDHLSRLQYTTAMADPRKAPTVPRPEMPWDAIRDEYARAKSVVMRSLMFPHEVTAADLEWATPILMQAIEFERR